MNQSQTLEDLKHRIEAHINRKIHAGQQPSREEILQVIQFLNAFIHDDELYCQAIDNFLGSNAQAIVEKLSREES